MTVHLNSAGIEEILKSDAIRAQVVDLAEQIAERVDKGGVPDAEVIVETYTTDRAAAIVIIAHPAGAAMQAKHGTLTRAAASVGMTVRSK